jgi:hypothetical protein
VIEPWLDKELDFELIAEPYFHAVRKLCTTINGTFLLKHINVVARHKGLPSDVVMAALLWCARFADHPDAPDRLSRVLRRGGSADATIVTRVAAKVLFHVDFSDVLPKVHTVASARSILGSLFTLGHTHALAEKLARIYFVRWLRDGRVFFSAQPETEILTAEPGFDQQTALIEALFTLIERRDLSPTTSGADEIALNGFCNWVRHWKSPDRNAIDVLVRELTDRYGLPNLWQQMMPDTKTT